MFFYHRFYLRVSGEFTPGHDNYNYYKYLLLRADKITKKKNWVTTHIMEKGRTL